MIPPRNFIALSWFIFVLTACTGGSIENEPFFNPDKYHHTTDGFRNPPDSPERVRKPGRFFSFILKRMTEDTGEIVLPENHVVPLQEAVAEFKTAPENARITWIGHAAFLIGWNGLNILSDPHFSERASPVSFAGPKRYSPPGLNLTDLPNIDVIIISHNHYDSFDEDSMRALSKHSPEALVLTPLGLQRISREWGFKNTKDMDWYDRHTVRDVTFMATPAIHRANRWLFDVNETLWAGFTMESKGKKIWFVGDTGMGPVFEREVRNHIAPVDISLTPVGAFLPREVMNAVHTSPEEGLELASMMGSKTAIGAHWGTFPLGADKPLQAVERVKHYDAKDMKKVMMRVGQTLDLRELW